MRAVFAGTPQFAATILEAMLSAGWKVPLVISQPDAPWGRGRQLRSSEVSALARSKDLPLTTPQKITELEHRLSEVAPDLMVVAAYGQIIPERIFSIPTCGTVNVHASLLPKYRGASPISASILAGDHTTGVSLMQIEAGLDTGPVFAQKAVAISNTDTTGSLTDKLAAAGAQLLIESAPKIVTGELLAERQDDAVASLAPTLAKHDGRIDWNQPAEAVERHIRAMQPWPGAWTELAEQRIEILAVTVTTPDSAPGQLAADGHVGTTQGGVQLVTVKPAGKKAMPATDWLRGLQGELPPFS